MTFRPRTRVSFPWNLNIGDDCWIGEGVWFHNQTQVSVGDNCVISQEAFITTGSHAVRTDMALVTSPVTIDSGAWVTSRCMVLGGATLGASCVITPNTVVPAKTVVPPNAIFGNPNPAQVLDHRFPTKSD
ncbi:UNVERIFIED_ORG: acetyltransferase-like isoleucine patch superfamily enzyme [Paenarthrobacter nicotinovorans]